MALYYAQADGDVDTIAWNTVRLGGGTALTWPPAITDDLNAGGFDLVVNDDIDVEDFDLEDGSLDIEAVTFRCRGDFNADGPSSITSSEATAPTIVVDGDLTLVGTSGNLVTVNNVDFDVSGSATAAYTSATDSDASAGNPIFTSNFTNGGGNKWWGERWFAKANANFSLNTNWHNHADGVSGIDMTADDFNAANTYDANAFTIVVDLGTTIGTPLRFVELRRTNAGIGGIFEINATSARWTQGIVRGTAAGTARCVRKSSTGKWWHTGDVYGSSADTFSYGVQHYAGDIEITGSVFAGARNSSNGISSQATNLYTITVSGGSTGGAGSTSHGIDCSNTVNLVVGGTTTGGATATSRGIRRGGAGISTLTGSVLQSTGMAIFAESAVNRPTWIFSGAGNQTYNQSNATSVGIIQVTKSAGTLTLASGVSCDSFTATGPARIEGAYTITVSGALALNGTQDDRVYIIGPDFAVTGAATATWCYVKDSASTGTIILAASSYGEGTGNTGWWFETISTADVEAIAGDTGITLLKALEIIGALATGKVTKGVSGSDVVLTYFKRDNTTTSFVVTADTTDGTRDAAGALS